MRKSMILPLLIAAAICRSATAGDTYTLHEQIKVGQSTTYVIAQTSHDNKNQTTNGVPTITDTVTGQYWKVAMTARALSNGSPTQADLAFDPASFDSSRDAGQPADKKTDCPFAGKTILLARLSDGTAINNFQGKASDDDVEFLNDLINPDGNFFPDKPVAVGDTWDNSAKFAKGQGLGPKDHLSGQCKLDWVKIIGDKQMAQISYTVDVKVHNDAANGSPETDVAASSTGTVLVDIAAGQIVVCDSKYSAKTTTPPGAADKLVESEEDVSHNEIVSASTVWPPVWPPQAPADHP
jgi:hypothetical protein